MQRYFCVALLVLATMSATAQVQKLPPFSVMQTSGQPFATTALPKDRPTLLVYFAPDCDHCITFLNALFRDFGSFSRTQVLLVTFKPVNDLRPIERSYGTARYKNVVVGSEIKPLYLQTYYRLQNTPFVALFDKNGILIRAYRKDPSAKDLAGLVSRLK